MTPYATRTLAALGACKTAADFYRIQIDLQQHATPAEVAFLTTRPMRWPQEFDTWLDALFAMMTLNNRRIEPFSTRRLNDHISLYEGTGSRGVLAIGFCGVAGLLFMPIPYLLQYFAAENTDVLVLRDPTRAGFIAGVRGYAGSFRDLMDGLRRDLNFPRYGDIRIFGTSGGGAAALAAGVLVGSARAVSFSGHLPTSSQRYAAEAATTDLEDVLRTAPARPGDFCVYGAANQRDAANAVELANLLQLRLYPVASVADHNVVFDLHRRHLLSDVLADVGLFERSAAKG